MDRVFLKNGGTGAVKQFRHVLVSPALAQQHAMRMHLAAEHSPPVSYERGIHEEERTGTVIDVIVNQVRAHRQIADTVCMQAGYTASVVPDGVMGVYFFHVQTGDLNETCNLT